jgi:hypothetical protein
VELSCGQRSAAAEPMTRTDQKIPERVASTEHYLDISNDIAA